MLGGGLGWLAMRLRLIIWHYANTTPNHCDYSCWNCCTSTCTSHKELYIVCTYIMVQWKMGPLKRCVACLQNSKRSTSIDLKKKSMDHLARHYQRNHDRTNRKQDEDFPKKKQTAGSDSKFQLCVSPQFLEKSHAFFGEKIASPRKIIAKETHPANHAHPRHMLLFWCTSSWHAADGNERQTCRWKSCLTWYVWECQQHHSVQCSFCWLQTQF